MTEHRPPDNNNPPPPSRKQRANPLLDLLYTLLFLRYCRPAPRAVTVQDGHSYERVAVEAWFRGHDTSPKNGGPALASKAVVPNHALRNSIEEWQQENCKLIPRTALTFRDPEDQVGAGSFKRVFEATIRLARLAPRHHGSDTPGPGRRRCSRGRCAPKARQASAADNLHWAVPVGGGGPAVRHDPDHRVRADGLARQGHRGRGGRDQPAAQGGDHDAGRFWDGGAGRAEADPPRPRDAERAGLRARHGGRDRDLGQGLGLRPHRQRIHRHPQVRAGWRSPGPIPRARVAQERPIQRAVGHLGLRGNVLGAAHQRRHPVLRDLKRRRRHRARGQWREPCPTSGRVRVPGRALGADHGLLGQEAERPAGVHKPGHLTGHAPDAGCGRPSDCGCRPVHPRGAHHAQRRQQIFVRHRQLTLGKRRRRERVSFRFGQYRQGQDQGKAGDHHPGRHRSTNVRNSGPNTNPSASGPPRHRAG